MGANQKNGKLSSQLAKKKKHVHIYIYLFLSLPVIFLVNGLPFFAASKPSHCARARPGGRVVVSKPMTEILSPDGEQHNLQATHELM